MSTIGTGRAIALVARREFRTQVGKRSFLISNLITLVVIVGGIIAYSIFSGNGQPSSSSVGLVGDQSIAATIAAVGDAAGAPVDVEQVADAQTARDRVTSGDLDAALVPGDGGSYTAITASELGATLQSILQTAVTEQARAAALVAVGVDPAEIAARTADAVVTVSAIDPPDPERGQRVALSMIAVILLYGQILLFGMYVAMGVVEEKSSRVVELLLSTLRPMQLLWGKIFGIGAVGLAQMTVYGVVGVATGLATGTLTITGAALGTLASVLGWFVLGYLFFAVLYAAGGSLVSRQEDVSSTTTPLTLLIMAMFFSAIFSINNPDNTLIATLSWIPPFSAILMPLRIASGVATPLQIVTTVVLMILATALLSAVAARIYQRSILRVGRTVGWREAFARQ
ncbi:ABC transporter permease [Millisia brevis]|uniref:ABC transporter permease n=1 Tax=Millisia brevis TaxID=264148 RepID=UPI00082F32C3|nr:ABC transporter permease [Millisia brevis]